MLNSVDFKNSCAAAFLPSLEHGRKRSIECERCEAHRSLEMNAVLTPLYRDQFPRIFPVFPRNIYRGLEFPMEPHNNFAASERIRLLSAAEIQ